MRPAARMPKLTRRSRTLVVIALVVVMAVVIPVINQEVAYDDPVKAGDVIELEGGVQFVPTPGWGIVSGLRSGEAPATG